MEGPCLLLMGLRDLGKFSRGWGLGIMWSPLVRGAWWSLCIHRSGRGRVHSSTAWTRIRWTGVERFRRLMLCWNLFIKLFMLYY